MTPSSAYVKLCFSVDACEGKGQGQRPHAAGEHHQDDAPASGAGSGPGSGSWRVRPSRTRIPFRRDTRRTGGGFRSDAPPFGAVSSRTETTRKTQRVEIRMIESVRFRSSRGIVRLNTCTSSRPRRRLHISRNRIPALVVLTPPPVEPGDAPTNIRRIIIRMVSLVSSPMSTVLKPAVRGVIDWKRDASTWFCHGQAAAGWHAARTRRRAAPRLQSGRR